VGVPSAAFAGCLRFMFLRRAPVRRLTSRVYFFLKGARSLDRRCPAHNAPHVPTSTDGLFAGLKSTSELERGAALSALRAFLRGALARSFARQLSDGDLDDVTQESLLRIHSRLDSFQNQSRFSTWACAIAVNCALSELRRRRHQHLSLEETAAQASAALVQEAEHADAKRELELARLSQGIADALTDRQRQAILAKLGGLPLMEIARRLSTSQGAVYKLLHDARMRLKRYLEAAEAASDERPTQAGSP
jgi:RNA polymerase sigma-70 factor (ECF subfamily)